ncbi:RdgB/HAM1 family non-canonical purine NTP pyrophosphatase [Geothrix sp. PMB-07]|uniref:RdgB/HAM1 family non-canonical purine NTP pyrophosphatase n=1 Tax=Geothrix sp. PMB-07 TaxID=3068640 RepID=UPI002740849E|nr:RdgB/HAM1 family non-canonical purine NTP pyrophosphatase [Geothrix sp. PMB-07]WLT32109.1 RdgB/HAM1 family non-canonical purine NTP pyrophosphatase [Geothrix sp. PMB-07]
MLKVLLASRNAGKLREFSELLPHLQFVLWPKDAPELPETGAFFQDNALQKAEGARAWWNEHGTEPVDGVLADDSGLCVDALWGGPGVLSARFAPDLSDYRLKNQRLLSLLPEVADRGARFVCVLAYLPSSGPPFTVSGSVEGSLAQEHRGEGGFGYDPIFIPQGHTRTFGELPSDIKHSLSHRARACAALKERLA